MSNYSINKIFDNSNVNAVIDRLYYEVGVAFPALPINEHMELTGRAAAILQGAASQACNNVILLVNDTAVYSFLQNTLPKIVSNKGVMKFKQRTIFTFEDLVLEVWPVVYPMDVLQVGGVYVQHISKINPILL